MKHCVCERLKPKTHPCHFVKKCGGVDYSQPIIKISRCVIFLCQLTLLILICGVPNDDSTFSQDAVQLDIQQLKL